MLCKRKLQFALLYLSFLEMTKNVAYDCVHNASLATHVWDCDWRHVYVQTIGLSSGRPETV